MTTRSKGRPLARDVVRHLRGVGRSSHSGPWSQVTRVSDLRPGDVVAWLTPEDSDSDNTGHVMIVLDAPTRSPRDATEWLVHIADATTSPHADDSRANGRNGLGTGTIGLVTDASGRPSAYYWRGGVSTKPATTTIALGRVD